jgi:hypothetical protein
MSSVSECDRVTSAVGLVTEVLLLRLQRYQVVPCCLAERFPNEPDAWMEME